MKFSVIFSFLTVLKQSIKLLSKNGKFIASIAALSLIITSTLLLLYSCFYLSLTVHVTASSTGPDTHSGSILDIPKYLAILFSVELVFLFVFFSISHVLGIATVLVSSASYNERNISSEEVFSTIRRTWRKPLSAAFRFQHHLSMRYLSFISFPALLLVFMYPNIITISIAIILGTAFFILTLHWSVVQALSFVVSILEECSPDEAVTKAGDLIKGHHLKGFILNLLANLLFLLVFGLLFMLNDKGSINLTVYGLSLANLFSIVKMVLSMAYTVLYFQCKEHDHGGEIGVHGNLEYSKLPNTIVNNDIP